ncbi:MAG: hypothetical protein WBJ52_01260 [Methanoregulaceae archaeon]
MDICIRFERSRSAQRVGMLKAATGQRCECCGRMVGAHVLELHCIPGIADHLRARDATSHILVLCPGCHASMHTHNVPEREQRLLVDARPAETEERIRKVFLQRPYTPPPSPDPEELFASVFASGGMDIFLNGA